MGTQDFRIHVGGLTEGVQEADLKKRFSPYGTVTDIDVKSQSYATGEWMKTFAFINLQCSRARFSECLRQLNNTSLNGGHMKLQQAREDRFKRIFPTPPSSTPRSNETPDTTKRPRTTALMTEFGLRSQAKKKRFESSGSEEENISSTPNRIHQNGQNGSVSERKSKGIHSIDESSKLRQKIAKSPKRAQTDSASESSDSSDSSDAEVEFIPANANSTMNQSQIGENRSALSHSSAQSSSSSETDSSSTEDETEHPSSTKLPGLNGTIKQNPRNTKPKETSSSDSDSSSSEDDSFQNTIRRSLTANQSTPKTAANTTKEEKSSSDSDSSSPDSSSSGEEAVKPKQTHNAAQWSYPSSTKDTGDKSSTKAPSFKVKEMKSTNSYRKFSGSSTEEEEEFSKPEWKSTTAKDSRFRTGDDNFTEDTARLPERTDEKVNISQSVLRNLNQLNSEGCLIFRDVFKLCFDPTKPNHSDFLLTKKITMKSVKPVKAKLSKVKVPAKKLSNEKSKIDQSQTTPAGSTEEEKTTTQSSERPAPDPKSKDGSGKSRIQPGSVGVKRTKLSSQPGKDKKTRSAEAEILARAAEPGSAPTRHAKQPNVKSDAKRVYKSEAPAMLAAKKLKPVPSMNEKTSTAQSKPSWFNKATSDIMSQSEPFAFKFPHSDKITDSPSKSLASSTAALPISEEANSNGENSDWSISSESDLDVSDEEDVDSSH